LKIEQPLGSDQANALLFRLSAFGHKENVIEAVERIKKKWGK
jgi:hypothetical protein